MTMNNLKTIALALLALVALIYATLYTNSKKEVKRLGNNQATLLEQVTYYRTADSLSAASVGKLTLERDEFKRYNADLVKSAEKLNLKIRRLEAAIQTATKTEYIVKTEIKDSLVYVPGQPAPVKVPCIDYNDKWLTIDGCIINREFEGKITSIDSLDHFINRVPRFKLLGMQIGTKGVKLDVVSKNPHSQIYYLQYIAFKK